MKDLPDINEQLEQPTLSSAFVQQLVSDEYHSKMLTTLGETYLEYRNLWNCAINGKLQLSHPIHVDFELFNSCNYRCSFCPYSAPKGERPKGFNVRGSQRLETDLIEKVLKEASGRLYAVELGYNTEPLLHQDIIEVIRLCKKYGVIDIRMGTNGSMLNQIDHPELVHSGLTQLQVSVDATDPESYMEARQSKLYGQVVSNIHSFANTRNQLKSLMPILRLTYVMTPRNKPLAEKFANQWAGIADIIGLQDLITYSDINLAVNASGMDKAVQPDFPGCYMPKVRLSVRSDGSVHPCCTVPGMRLRVGNVRHQRLDEIWSSPSMTSIRSSHFDGSWTKNLICSDCISGTLK